MNGLREIRRQCRLNEWNLMVQERMDSGLSTREYCKQKGIGVKIYYYRLKKLREAAVELAALEIVQVEAPVICEQNNIVIRTNSATEEILTSSNPETVRAAVSFLERL